MAGVRAQGENLTQRDLDKAAGIDATKRGSGPQPNDGLTAPSLAKLVGERDCVFLCAEPGMGKTYLVSQVAEQMTRSGASVHRFAFEDMASDKACRKLIRAMRELGKRLEEGQKTLVIIDGVASPDEYEAASEERAIERLRSKGCRIIVCIRPEAEQLMEVFDQVLCLRCDDLLFRSHNTDSEMMDMTGGIPALVAALRLDLASDEPSGRTTRYLSALEDVVKGVLRNGLTREELRLRLAMLLLGHGNAEELALAAGRCDTELLGMVSRDVALLGIHMRDRTFRCHGIVRDDIFGQCAMALQAAAASEPDLVIRACGILASRGDVRRSALVCRLCASERDFASVGVTWGVAYACVGEAKLVAEAAKAARTAGTGDRNRVALGEAAVACLAGSSKSVEAALEKVETLRLASSLEERMRQSVVMLGACRTALRNPRQLSVYPGVDMGDVFGAACHDHVRVVRALASGRFGEAYATLSNDMILRDVETVADLMLCDDLYLALLLSGGAPDARERRLFDSARDFLAATHVGRLATYHSAVEAIPGILMASRLDATSIEEAAAQAERAGDRYFESLCLTVCAVADIRLRALSRAHVRANRAAKAARVLGEKYLASSAELVDALALEMLGEADALSRYVEKGGHPEGLALLGQLASVAVRGPEKDADQDKDAGQAEDANPAAIPMGMPCPRDSLWALALMLEDCADLGNALMGAIPPTWLELLRAVRRRQHDALGKDAESDASAAASAPTGALGSQGTQGELMVQGVVRGRVHIRVLGGFAVEIDGRPCALKYFERRRARDLTMLLALTPGHRLPRYRVIEVLWPGDDYILGLRKLYEATSEARRLLSGPLKDVNPIFADRAQGTIGFDVSLISCDVDEFEREARMALAEDGDDFWVLEHARLMERRYASGPDSRISSMGARVGERLEELRTLYVDGAVAAGEAALRLGKTKLAVRYANDAHRLCDLREDAMILLVRALRAAGRSFEIPPLYKHYSRHLIRVEGVPPSIALRQAVELATGDLPEEPMV